VSAENRLTVYQLLALAPGDTVTIESGADFSRPRHSAGTVVRIGLSHVVVRVEGPRGGTYIEHYSLRHGLLEGRGRRAELVAPDTDNPATRDLLRRRTQRIDNAYRQWSRRRADVEALRELRDAINDQLQEAPVPLA
jgi:hypothetical protein